MAEAVRIKGDAPLSHNLLGQRLGRKGRDTRKRILAAAERVLADPQVTFSLSAVAREASVGMTTLYPYFADLTELLLAVLEPIMASSESSYVAKLRGHWPDDALDRECLAFVMGFHGFWHRHSRILHLRNAHGATGDPRLARHRTESAMPLIRLLMLQMNADVSTRATFDGGVATALLTGMERVVTLVTDPSFADVVPGEAGPVIEGMLRGQAHVLALAIHVARTRNAGTAGGEVAAFD